MSDQQKAAPSSRSFHVTNVFQTVLDMHAAGYSEADIRWILDTIGWTEPLRQALAADAIRRAAVQP